MLGKNLSEVILCINILSYQKHIKLVCFTLSGTNFDHGSYRSDNKVFYSKALFSLGNK